jgi:hypothetical protein
MPLFRRRPTTIEARQFTGGAESATPIIDWVLAGGGTATWMEAHQVGIAPYRPDDINEIVVMERISLRTLEGTIYVSVGDWVIKGTAGEFYPCKPEIFADVYEPLE